MSRTAIACTTIGTLGLVISAAVLSAGPLDPPAGPVASSYKTLTEVEPRTPISAATTPGDSNSVFKITQPGSYYLTGNIAGVSGKAGIEIGVNGVTIDLSGFDVLGTAGSLSGIRVEGTLSTQGQITVRNGTVRGWGDSGISLNTVTAAPVMIEHVAANYNGLNGILTGPNATISVCQAMGNTNWGIICGTRCLVERCTASGNGLGTAPAGGIFTSHNSTVQECVAVSNGTGSGMGRGISAGNTCIVSRCVASTNGTGAAGGVGISVGDLALVEDCSSSNNGQAGASSGFGIVASSGVVRGCAVEGNAFEGINCAFQSVISGNTCVTNGIGTLDGTNIHVTGPYNRIEENHCNGSSVGIKVDSGDNVIVRNTCVVNVTNYVIAPGNDAGPIGTAGTSTSPWANIQR